MKKISTAFLSAIIATIPLSTFSQDILTTRDGTELKVKVTEITEKKVKYKTWDNQDGPTYSTEKDGILFIKYENGKKDVFKVEASDQLPEDKMTLKDQGAWDAEEYYTGYQGPRMGTYFVTALTGPLIGLIPAISCSRSAPDWENLGYPDSTLMENKTYRKAYIKKAKSIKAGKTWGGWGWGVFTNIIVGVGLAFILSQP